MTITVEQISSARSVPIVDVIGESVALSEKGSVLVGVCPFCAEPKGFTVNPRGFFLCFKCKTSGTQVDFLMKRFGIPFGEAVERLTEKAVPAPNSLPSSLLDWYEATRIMSIEERERIVNALAVLLGVRK